MPKRSKPPTELQITAREINMTIGLFGGLQFRLKRLGYYDFQQRVRELEEQFRAKTNRKEKD